MSYISKDKFFLTTQLGTGEVAQQLRAFVVVAGLGSIPSTHIVTYNHQ